MRTSIMNLAAALTGKYSVTKSALVLLAALASLQAFVPLFANLKATLILKFSVTKLLLVLFASLASLQGCVTLTEEEREQLAYDLNEARSIYEERRQACLDSGAYMVTKTLTGARRLTIAEMEWAYCVR